jgi:glycosyltransferase involved in cell wall biosynthesis
MNIAINTLSVTPQRGGVKTYLTNFIKKLAEVDRNNIYYLFVSPINETLFDIKKENFKKIYFPLYSDNRILRIMLEQLLIPFYIKKHKIDVLFSPGNFATIFPGCKQVLVIQGPLTIREIREKYAHKEISWMQGFYYNIMLPISARRADKIIAVSNDIKKHLLNQVKIPEQKIQVIHEGVDLNFLKNSVGEPPHPRPYILFLSTLFKYKNADKLLMAFAKLKNERKIPHSLVIVGRDPRNEMEKLKRIVDEEKLSDYVIFTGAVPHERIAPLYKNADVFVYPSSVETFGLPVLEAMACGTPVVASNRMSVPEVAGDAALIVDPDNIEEMAEAIYRVITDEKLRERLIKKGYERVKQFSWEKTARETLRVFEEVYNFGR